jgi:hypothetical protein
MNSPKRQDYFSMILCVSLAGCIDGPTANSNSSINGNLVGEWRLKVEEMGAGSDAIHRLTFSENGRYLRVDSSCFVSQPASGPLCNIQNRWGGRYERAGSAVTLFKISDSMEILSEELIIRDTMTLHLRRLDENALVMVYKIHSAAGTDSLFSRYYRVK